MPPLFPLKPSKHEGMQIDFRTMKSLEIRDCEGRSPGSLFDFVKRTKTNGGTRLLMRWICEILYYSMSCLFPPNLDRFTQSIAT